MAVNQPFRFECSDTGDGLERSVITNGKPAQLLN
jgi:hypothetical protein